MPNFFCENQDAVTYLVYQVQESDELDSMSIKMMTNNAIPGFADSSVTKIDDTEYIRYIISEKVSVGKLFSGVVTKKRLLGVFVGIVDAMLAADEYMIDNSNLLLDLEYIFTDVDTCETVMICLPLMNTEGKRHDVGMFFKNIIFNIQIDQNENTDYVPIILHYVSNNPVCSLSDFKVLLSKLAADDETMKCEQTEISSAGAVNAPWIGRPDLPMAKKVQWRKEQQFVRKKPNSSQRVPTAEENPMSLFYLLMHYSKENLAIYKDQQKGMKKDSSRLNKSAKKKTEIGADVHNSKPQVELSKVQFSAISPECFTKGKYCIVDIFMYEELYREVLDRLICEAEHPVQECNSGVHNVEKNARIRIALTSPDIEISDNEDDAVWGGGYLRFSYPVCVPKGYRNGQVRFCATVYINEVVASRIRFVAKCTSKQKQRPKIEREDIMSAFISYASKDRSRVAMVVQGIKKARPDLKVFFDVDSLKSGEYWENTIKKEIVARDIFYLFWSNAARESEWVEKEWRYALTQKGIDFIDPIPIDSPDTCPPPEELSKKHFNDRMLNYIF